MSTRCSWKHEDHFKTQDSNMNITGHFRGIYRIYYPNLIKDNRRMSICNRSDLQTLGSQPVIMLKSLLIIGVGRIGSSLQMNRLSLRNN